MSPNIMNNASRCAARVRRIGYWKKSRVMVGRFCCVGTTHMPGPARSNAELKEVCAQGQSR